MWAVTSLPYIEEMLVEFEDLSEAAGQLDLARVKRLSQDLADSARSFRLALQTAGPAPAPLAVAGPAVIEAAANLETSSRAVAACVGISDCTVRIAATSADLDSWASAVEDLTSTLEETRLAA